MTTAARVASPLDLVAETERAGFGPELLAESARIETRNAWIRCQREFEPHRADAVELADALGIPAASLCRSLELRWTCLVTRAIFFTRPGLLAGVWRAWSEDCADALSRQRARALCALPLEGSREPASTSEPPLVYVVTDRRGNVSRVFDYRDAAELAADVLAETFSSDGK